MISIVIVTCNSVKPVQLCLDSIFAQKCDSVEVIVVDNGSKDGTAGLIGRNYPGAVLIRNERNEGACKARNQGIERARGEWILTLDSDCALGEGFLSGFEALRAGFPPDVGMAVPDILSRDGKTVYSRGIYLTLTRRFYDLNSGQPRLAARTHARSVIGPCAAAGFYRRGMLERLKEKTGYFDERFFFLVEDVDLAWRAERAGWKAASLPQLACFHDGNGSGTDGQARQFFCYRNRYLMIAKNEDLPGKLRVFILSAPREAARSVYMLLCNKYMRMQAFRPLKSLAKQPIL
jgi:GT2 family glycosyltransferase